MNIYQALIPIEREIVKACCEKNICQLDYAEFLFKMNGLIAKTHIQCGFAIDKEAVAFILRDLCDELKKYFSLMTFSEIEIAFRNGWKNTEKDFYGLNEKTYLSWVNAYSQSESRLKAKKMLLEAKENSKMQPAEKTEAEKEEDVRIATLQKFSKFKEGLVFFDWGNPSYNFLEKKGLINFSLERKKTIKKMVEEKRKAHAINEKRINESIEIVVKKALEEDAVISDCKREALNIYFKELVEMEIELIDLLEPQKIL